MLKHIALSIPPLNSQQIAAGLFWRCKGFLSRVPPPPPNMQLVPHGFSDRIDTGSVCERANQASGRCARPKTDGSFRKAVFANYLRDTKRGTPSVSHSPSRHKVAYGSQPRAIHKLTRGAMCTPAIFLSLDVFSGSA